MTPADVIEGRARWCVVCADNADVLPTLPNRSVAHVITDPPYEAEAHTKHRTTRGVLEGRAPENSAALDFEPLTEVIRTQSASEFARLSCGWVLAFCQIEAVGAWRAALVAGGARWCRGQVWVKPDSSPQFTGDRPGCGHESIATAWAGGGRSRWNGGGRRGVYVYGVGVYGGEPNPHPTTKPLSLMLELVELFTDSDDVVLDPFAGSGTTGVACLRLGRRFIGIERDEKYAAVARERLEAESRGLSLRDARAGQISIFDTVKP